MRYIPFLFLVACSTATVPAAPASPVIENLTFIRCYDSTTLADINVSVSYQIIAFPNGVLASCSVSDGRSQYSWSVAHNNINDQIDTSCSVVMDGVGDPNGGYWIFSLQNDYTVLGQYKDPDVTRDISFRVQPCSAGDLMQPIPEGDDE